MYTVPMHSAMLKKCSELHALEFLCSNLSMQATLTWHSIHQNLGTFTYLMYTYLRMNSTNERLVPIFNDFDKPQVHASISK